MKKLTSIFLILCMLFSLAGCGAASKETAEEESVSEEAEEGTGTRTIVDLVGNEVVLPETIETVAIASVWPLAPVYIMAYGTEKLVGLAPEIIQSAGNSVLMKIAPEVVNISSDFSEGGYLNAEELAKLNPDVVLYSSGIPEDYEICSQLGIPAVGFALDCEGYNAVDTINTWIELLEEVMGEEISNPDYIAYGSEMQEFVAERLANVAEEDKPEIMIIHRYADNTVGVPGASGWGNYWITAFGGINAAAELSGTTNVGIEQVYEWDPDKILITNFNDAQPEDIYNNTLCSSDWSGLSAVQNGEVTKIPHGTYRWFVTSADAPLMLLWMAMQNHPALFEDVDFEQTMKDFYLEFHNMELTDEDVDFILNPPREIGEGV